MNLAPTGSTVEVLDASLGVVVHEGLDESEGVLDGSSLGHSGSGGRTRQGQQELVGWRGAHESIQCSRWLMRGAGACRRRLEQIEARAPQAMGKARNRLLQEAEGSGGVLEGDK